MCFRPVRLVALGLFLGLLVSAPAAAQVFGGRVGLSSDPDQFYFGAHLETPPLIDRLHFRPNVEVGVGNNLTLTSLNFEFAYHFPSQQRPWTFYAGGGPALNIFHTNNDTRTEPGFNIVLGVEHRRGLFTEVKIGTVDSPDLKFGVGYTFR